MVEVVAGLAERDGAVLLVQRHRSDVSAWSESWCFAGGKVEASLSESREQALAREWIEEHACRVAVGPLLHACVRRTEGYAQPYRVWTYVVELLGEPALMPAGGQAMRWVRFNDLPQYRVLPGTRESVDAYRALRGLQV